MSNGNIHFTKRMKRIMKNAEQEALHSEDRVLIPAHLLIACLYEKGGAMGEIILQADISLGSLREKAVSSKIHKTTNLEWFGISVTEEVADVFHIAIHYMNHYNQIFVNEGHLLKALIKSNVLDSYLSEETKQIILRLGTTSRDLITHLGSYNFPEIKSINIRKVLPEDIESLVAFVNNYFSVEWAKTIENGCLCPNPSVYIALDESNDLIGFAAYDVYLNKKGYFGPMGVKTSNRITGTGFALLHHCLKDMKAIGYEYAIIGDAGPIEFYEKACKAVVIPATI